MVPDENYALRFEIERDQTGRFDRLTSLIDDQVVDRTSSDIEPFNACHGKRSADDRSAKDKGVFGILPVTLVLLFSSFIDDVV